MNKINDQEARSLAAAAERYRVLDGTREQSLDEIALLAATICSTPIAVVTLFGEDRQFCKAEVGLGDRALPLACEAGARAHSNEDFVLVPDTAQDPRFVDQASPSGEPALRFYAGARLEVGDGHVVGTLCVLDHEARTLTPEQKLMLRTLARQAVAQLELKLTLRERDAELAQVQASEERLQLVLDTAREYVILTVDNNHRITTWSEGAQAAFEWTEAEALGRPFEDLFTPADQAAGVPLAELARAVADGCAPDIRWHLRADGTRVFLNGSTHLLPADEQGRPRGFLKIARDETERQRQADELVHTRAELVSSESRFRALVDISAAAVWTATADGTVTEDSPSWRAYTGQSVSEWVGTGWRDAVHPEDRDHAYAKWHEAVAAQSMLDTQFRLFHAASGAYRWVRVNAGPLRDEDGTLVEWVGMNTDIDEVKRSAMALEESETRFRNMADHAPVMMWVTDPSGTCTYLNRRWYEFTGQTEAEALGYGWLDATHPDDVATAGTAFIESNAAQTEFRVEYRLRRADGKYRWAIDAATPRFGADGEYLGYVGSVIDIDERREAELLLRQSEEQLRLATDAADVGMWDLDVTNEVLFWPARVKAMFGISPEVPISLADFYAGLHPDDLKHTSEAFASAADPERRAVYDVEYRTIGKEDGVVRWVAAKGRGLFDEDGRCARVLGTAIDITERKKTEERLRELNETLELRVAEEVQRRALAEEQLRQAHKMEAVGQLTGGIAHDFNNMLTGVIGSLDLIQRNIAAGKHDRVARYIDAANTSAQRAAALTARLLAFGRRQSLDLRPVDTNALVSGMEDLLHRTLGEQVALETHLASGLWAACSDANQLDSALLNLCINARDAMPHGGKLTIETSNTHLDARYAQEHVEVEPGDYVMISVSDTGTGMAPSTMEKVFEPFFTTKPVGEGTGLGLSMIYGFAKQSGGHIRIYSELGQGTTIKLYLPRFHGEMEAAEAAPREAPLGAGETVMVVEDDASVRLIVLEVLEELGYAAIEAVDARVAIPILESDRRIDLLVSDVGLPGLNGRQLAEIARQARPDLAILFITGYAQHAAVRGGFLAEGMEMMTKPFAVDALAGKIREMLGKA
jgi:PAS domain S-box-containing protein